MACVTGLRNCFAFVLLMIHHQSGSCCEDGWSDLMFGRQVICVRPFLDLVDRDTAENMCQEEGSSLISFSSVLTHVFVAIRMRTLYTFDVDAEFWIGLKRVDGELRWFDNSSVETNPFTVGLEKGDCYVIRNMREFLIRNCSYAAPFICEKWKFGTTQTTTAKAQEIDCPDHSVVISDKCYWRTTEPLSLNETEQKCAIDGGYLAEIHNSLYFREINEVMIILNLSSSNTFWTMLYRVQDVLQWKDGQPFDLHSNPLISVHPIGDGDCVVINLEPRVELKAVKCDFKALGLCQKKSITFSSTAPSVIATPTVTELGECPHGYNWKEDKDTGFCYWETSYETERLSWDDARKYCQSYGGDLASFHNLRQEQIGLSFQYGSLEHPYWIGLQLNIETNSYEWSDGTPVDYINWDENQPISTDQRMRCVQMNALKKAWIISYCGVLSWFICKAPKRINPKIPVLPTHEPFVNCAGSSTEYYFDEYCYSARPMVSSWHRAKSFCEDEGSDLVSIHSAKEVDFLLKLLYYNRALRGNRVWIGLNALGVDGEFRWTDHTILDFTNWDTTEPNNFQNQEKCCNMYIGNGFWNDENCNSPMGFICKRKNSTGNEVTVSTIQPIIGNCKKNWHKFDGRCYLPIGPKEFKKISWRDASLYCLTLGGHLASIRNTRDQVFLNFLMQELKSDIWIGLHDTIQTGSYYWTDNSPVTYTHWAPGEPSIFGKKEDCVLMMYGSQNGLWADEVCERNLSFICQTHPDSSFPAIPNPLNTRCIHPQGWLKSGFSCFKVYNQNLLSYQDAESVCVREGGHLVSASDFNTQAVMEYLAITNFDVNETFWIGLQLNSKNKMKWIDSWPVTQTKWDINEPSDLNILNTCFVSSASGLWKKDSCENRKKYICQVRAGKPPKEKQLSGSCQSASWIDIGINKCFSIDMVHKAEWYSANFQCFVQGGVLASFHSLDELSKIKEHIHNKFSPAFTIFIGLSRSSSGGFIWADGSPVDFVNWDQGAPRSDQCVALIIPSLKWKTLPCYSKLPYLCAFVKVNYKLERGNATTSETYSEHSIDQPRPLHSGIIISIVLFIFIVLFGVIFAIYHFGFRRHSHLPLFNREHQSTSFENVLFSDECNVEFQDKGSEYLRN